MMGKPNRHNKEGIKVPISQDLRFLDAYLARDRLWGTFGHKMVLVRI